MSSVRKAILNSNRRCSAGMRSVPLWCWKQRRCQHAALRGLTCSNQKGRQPLSLLPKGRHDGQQPLGKTTPGPAVRAKAPVAPQHGRPRARSTTFLVGSTRSTRTNVHSAARHRRQGGALNPLVPQHGSQGKLDVSKVHEHLLHFSPDQLVAAGQQRHDRRQPRAEGTAGNLRTQTGAGPPTTRGAAPIEGARRTIAARPTSTAGAARRAPSAAGPRTRAATRTGAWPHRGCAPPPAPGHP